MIFSLQVTLVVCHAIQAISLRFISGLLAKPNANTTALTCYAKNSYAVLNPSCTSYKSGLINICRLFL